jgi:hypothetical protein
MDALYGVSKRGIGGGQNPSPVSLLLRETLIPLNGVYKRGVSPSLLIIPPLQTTESSVCNDASVWRGGQGVRLVNNLKLINPLDFSHKICL